jgi:lactoylglutathione lyase
MPVSVIVFVADVEASLAFYESVLGVERDHLDDDGSYGELGSGVGFAASRHVARHLDLPFRQNDPCQPAAGFELEFAVEDVDAVFARALESGAVAVWHPRDKPWGRSALFRDPDGVFVHVSSA